VRSQTTARSTEFARLVTCRLKVKEYVPALVKVIRLPLTMLTALLSTVVSNVMACEAVVLVRGWSVVSRKLP
jgi:hypothetical protein